MCHVYLSSEIVVVISQLQPSLLDRIGVARYIIVSDFNDTKGRSCNGHVNFSNCRSRLMEIKASYEFQGATAVSGVKTSYRKASRFQVKIYTSLEHVRQMSQRLLLAVLQSLKPIVHCT